MNRRKSESILQIYKLALQKILVLFLPQYFAQESSPLQQHIFVVVIDHEEKGNASPLPQPDRGEVLWLHILLASAAVYDCSHSRLEYVQSNHSSHIATLPITIHSSFCIVDSNSNVFDQQ
jgi:hypothetical protein